MHKTAQGRYNPESLNGGAADGCGESECFARKAGGRKLRQAGARPPFPADIVRGYLQLLRLHHVYHLLYLSALLRACRASRKPKQLVAKKNHRYAVVVSARNESAVIGDLIHSIKVQNYPTELIDVFVIADNCTDNTADVAREAGAIVFKQLQHRTGWQRLCARLRLQDHPQPVCRPRLRGVFRLMPTTCST